MIEVARNAKRQPPPPTVVFEALAAPRRAAGRNWLRLADGEVEPRVITADPGRVVWSSLWSAFPSAQIVFDIALVEEHADSLLTWTLSVDPPSPDDETVAKLRHRLNEIINGDLRVIAFG